METVVVLLPYCSLQTCASLRATCTALQQKVEATAQWQDGIAEHPFTLGRIYQLIKDNWGDRKPERHLSIHWRIAEAFPTVADERAWAWANKGKWQNNWDSFRDSRQAAMLGAVERLDFDCPAWHPDKFHYKSDYLGRCVQFLLDSNHKRNIGPDDLSLDLIDEAHKWWERMCKPREGTKYHFKECDTCSSWTVGDRRCSCGNRRIDLVMDFCETFSLDTTSSDWHPEAY
jgi:hypothetical protein